MRDQLVLGTVQLGMDYGLNNTGKPDFKEACAIVKTAFDQGIRRFDTAQAYGDSEEVLGLVFDKLKLGPQVKVYSKLHPELEFSDKKVLKKSVDESLRKLKVEQLEGMLVHREEQLVFWEKGLGAVMQELVREGKIKSIGASFYTPQLTLDALDINTIDIFQVPANILDQRFDDAGVFNKAQKLRKDIFVRSIFLQGLLLMPLENVPESLKEIRPFLKQIDCLAQRMQVTRHELLLGYAAQHWPQSFVLFGASNSQQVVDNVKVFLKGAALKFDKITFKDVPVNLINPVFWPKVY